MIRGSFSILSFTSSGKASRTSNIPTNKSLQSSASSSMSKARTKEIIPLSRTRRPEYPITKSLSLIPHLLRRSATFCRSTRAGLNLNSVSIPPQVPCPNTICLLAGANRSSILRLRTEGLTHTISVAQNDASLSTLIKIKRLRPRLVS